MTAFNRLLIATWFLNLYDIAVTLYGTQELRAVEANPLMRVAVELSPALFIALKLFVVTCVCWVLHERVKTHRRRTWATLVIIFVLYLMICLWNTIVVVVMLS